MNKIVNIVLYKRYTNEKSGIIKLQLYDRVTKKQKHFTLKISIEDKYWDKKKQRVKQNHPDQISINNKIDDFLASFKANNSMAPRLSITDPTYKPFYQLFITGYNSYGTLKKYNTINNYIIEYISKIYKRDDYRLADIDASFINGFNKFLTEKGLASSTVSRIHKNFKTILNKARLYGYFTPLRDPFIAIKYESFTKPITYLEEDEIRRIINVETTLLDEGLQLTRLMCLSSIFGQGMRISDLLLLRFNHISSDGTLDFNMYKTKKSIKIEVNNMLRIQLFNALLNYQINEVEHETYADAIEDFISDSELLRLERPKVKHSSNNDEIVLETLNANVKRSFNKLITEAKKILGNEFVFPMLDIEDFPEENREHLSKFQFNQIMSKTTMYNKRLKRLMNICQIHKKVSSHTMRHTFSNQVLSPHNANIYEISKSLGHSSIKETETYLRKFDEGKVRTMMDGLSDKYE